MSSDSALHSFSSVCAGALSTLMFYPLDTLKIRYMSQDGTAERRHHQTYYRHVHRSVATIVEREGVRALYYGAHVAIMGSAMSWGLYMFFYREMIRLRGHVSFLDTSVISCASSAVTSLMMCPVWVIKLRMQVEDAPTTGRQYRTFSSSARCIVVTSGWRGLWRGAGAQLLVGIPHSLQLPIYEAMKRWLLRRSGKAELSYTEVSACSLTAKTLLCVTFHPLFVAKTRIQDYRSHAGSVHYESLIPTLRTIFKREGLRGLQRGVSIAMMQSLPRSWMQFTLYETFLSFLSNPKKKFSHE